MNDLSIDYHETPTNQPPSKKDSDRVSIRDQSADRKYFIMVPQIVMALCRDPYDYTLWSVIKMIAGEQGECFLSTPDLADLAMMSVGKVHECRKYLLEQGLLRGEKTKDPSYPWPVWRLTVPDLWERNLEWRKGRDSLKLRIQEKRDQKELKCSPDEKTPSSDEILSPGEKSLSPDVDKEEPSKKNHQNNHAATAVASAVGGGFSGNGKEPPVITEDHGTVLTLLSDFGVNLTNEIKRLSAEYSPAEIEHAISEPCKMREVRNKPGLLIYWLQNGELPKKQIVISIEVKKQHVKL